jgi:orotate phosphoribosyltransferase
LQEVENSFDISIFRSFLLTICNYLQLSATSCQLFMQILNHFKQSGALLEGHFILSSGLHSPNYLQCALALQYPPDAAKFGRAMAERFTNENIETVASPAIGGLVIGFAVAQALDVRFVWTERENGVMTLRRGFSVKETERILVVEDVITTGGSTRECIEALEKHGAKVVGAASIIDRSGGRADVGVPRIALATLDVPSYKTEDCPMCARGEIAVKPGSRAQIKI